MNNDLENDYYVVGNRQEIIGGAVFSAEQTDNGVCYKDERAIIEHKGICYIAECCFYDNDSDTMFDENGNLIITIDNIDKLIEKGGVSTWASAEKQVKQMVAKLDYFNEFWKHKSGYDLFCEFVTKITKIGFDIVDWQCFGTWLCECDLEEELNIFFAEKNIKNE